MQASAMSSGLRRLALSVTQLIGELVGQRVSRATPDQPAHCQGADEEQGNRPPGNRLSVKDCQGCSRHKQASGKSGIAGDREK
jgi:hypothetical protein